MANNRGSVSKIRLGNSDYNIKDETLRTSFVKLSDIMRSNNAEIRNFMDSTISSNSYLSYNLGNATSFLYAFSEICINHISNLYQEIAYLKDDIAYLKNNYDWTYNPSYISY